MATQSPDLRRSNSKGKDAEEGAVVDTGREKWGNHIEFFLSSVGLAVGLGNIWRFPSLAYEYGGATFMIPYLLMLAIVGMPLFFLEMTLGQYTGLSVTKVFKRLAPGISGLGYGMMTIMVVVNIQYVMVMAYALYYLFLGLAAELPWGKCNPDWATKNCYSLLNADACSDTETYYNLQCMPGAEFCEEFGLQYKSGRHCYVDGIESNEIKFKDVTYRNPSSEDFWFNYVLQFSQEHGHVDTSKSSWEHWGGMRWEVLGCLALAWTLIVLSLIKGLQSYGKVVYFTTLFPYVVLTIILGYSATLDGFTDGISYYLVPNDFWSLFKSIEPWKQAAIQIFYSLAIGSGSQLLLSSYNPFDSNCHRDALLIAVCNSGTSIYGGLSVFGVLGYLAKTKGVDIGDVAQSGGALVFIVYPEALALMDVAPLFSFLFFLMLCLLATSSVCGQWESLVAVIFDEIPSLKGKRKTILCGTAFCAFVLAIPMCFQSGTFLFEMMNNRCSNSTILLSLIEVITVAWFYGVDKWMDNIAAMSIQLPNWLKKYWATNWKYITPFIVIVLTIVSYLEPVTEVYADYEYPVGVQVAAWTFEFLGLIVAFVISFVVVVKHWRAGEELSYVKTGPMMTPSHKWGARADSGLKTGQANAAFEE